MRIVRGDIVIVDFGHHEETSLQSGIRPAVVVSNNKANYHSPIITVVPLSSRISKKTNLPTHIDINIGDCIGLERQSIALAEQIIAIDKMYVLNRAGFIKNHDVMSALTNALQIQVGVYENFN